MTLETHLPIDVTCTRSLIRIPARGLPSDRQPPNTTDGRSEFEFGEARCPARAGHRVGDEEFRKRSCGLVRNSNRPQGCERVASSQQTEVLVGERMRFAE
jgi:hypothetical protein